VSPNLARGVSSLGVDDCAACGNARSQPGGDSAWTGRRHLKVVHDIACRGPPSTLQQAKNRVRAGGEKIPVWLDASNSLGRFGPGAQPYSIKRICIKLNTIGGGRPIHPVTLKMKPWGSHTIKDRFCWGGLWVLGVGLWGGYLLRGGVGFLI